MFTYMCFIVHNTNPSNTMIVHRRREKMGSNHLHVSV
jgi:hypothetical protein